MSGRVVVLLIAAGVATIACISIALAVFTEDPRLPAPTPTPASGLRRTDAAHRSLIHPCYHDCMERTTISLPRELIVRLRVMAAERRTSMAAIIREALEEKTRSHPPKPRSLGIGDSGHTDTARLLGEERVPPVSWR